MYKKLYELPVPSTALLKEPLLQFLPMRTCVLVCEYENDHDGVSSLRIIFDGIEALKSTYLYACPIELIRAAYDKVIDLGATQWFSEITERLSGTFTALPELHHLAIFFDDGPCYEFICKEVRIEIKQMP
jgi:hypothetical protein